MSVNSKLKTTKTQGMHSIGREFQSLAVRVKKHLGMVTEKSRNLSKYNKQTSLDSKEVEPVQPVQMNTYQTNTYRKYLSCLHFDDEPMV